MLRCHPDKLVAITFGVGIGGYFCLPEWVERKWANVQSIIRDGPKTQRFVASKRCSLVGHNQILSATIAGTDV